MHASGRPVLFPSLPAPGAAAVGHHPPRGSGPPVTTWLTADWHLGHANIITYSQRPFPDVRAMHRALVEWHNELVSPQDTVWVLGDVAFGWALDLVTRLHGHKILVPGNHDRCWRGARHGDPDAARAYLDAGFDEIIHDPPPLIAGTTPVRLSHFPYEGDSGPRDRYVSWRPRDSGDWLACGHVHRKWRQHRRQINVGVDAWAGRPVSLADLAGLIKTGPAERAPLPSPW